MNASSKHPMATPHPAPSLHVNQWVLSIQPNIPVWNYRYSVWWMERYVPFRWTNPSQVIRFQVSCENTKSNGGLFNLCLLNTCFGIARRRWSWNKRCITRGWQYNFYRKNLKGLCDYIKGMIPLYFPDEFKSHFRMTSELITRAVMLTFHV